MDKIYIGIDNGVSGSIGIVGGHNQGTSFVTPVKLQQDYTKKQKNLNRLDILCFKGILNEYAHYHDEDNKDLARVAIIERPFVNPMMFQASISAVRCLEAQLCVLESMEISFMFIDSKEWQKALLPYIPLKKKEGETIKEKRAREAENRKQIKKASHDIGIRLFPSLKEEIEAMGDADGILIAEYARRNNL